MGFSFSSIARNPLSLGRLVAKAGKCRTAAPVLQVQFIDGRERETVGGSKGVCFRSSQVAESARSEITPSGGPQPTGF
jgi:hypothetical protein